VEARLVCQAGGWVHATQLLLEPGHHGGEGELNTLLQGVRGGGDTGEGREEGGYSRQVSAMCAETNDTRAGWAALHTRCRVKRQTCNYLPSLLHSVHDQRCAAHGCWRWPVQLTVSEPTEPFTPFPGHLLTHLL
jgi:hypothetical protein